MSDQSTAGDGKAGTKRSTQSVSAESLARVAIALAAAERKTKKFPYDADACRIHGISEGGVMDGYFRRAERILAAAGEFIEPSAVEKRRLMSEEIRSYSGFGRTPPERQRRKSLAKAAEAGGFPGAKTRQGIRKRLLQMAETNLLPADSLFVQDFAHAGKAVRRQAWHEVLDTNTISDDERHAINRAWDAAVESGKLSRPRWYTKALKEKESANWFGTRN